MNKTMFRVGIIGAGWIAEKMAAALSPLEDYCVYAIASRSIIKAQEFAERWNIEKAYGSYEEMVSDDKVDLVYIATPHSHHFPHAKLALHAGKPVLVEKAFTANTTEAEELIATAREKDFSLLRLYGLDICPFPKRSRKSWKAASSASRESLPRLCAI